MLRIVPPTNHVPEDHMIESLSRSLSDEDLDLLRDAFIAMDKDSNGYVSVPDVGRAVRDAFGEERAKGMMKYLQPLFIVADKDRDAMLSLSEFLSSFVEGPGVVPMDVVTALVRGVRVRLSDEEMFVLEERFRSMDVKGDGLLDEEELREGLKVLLSPRFPEVRDGMYSKLAKLAIETADADRDGKLSLLEFIRSYQEDQGVLPAAFLDLGSSARSPTRPMTGRTKGAFRELVSGLEDFAIDTYKEVYHTLWDAFKSFVGPARFPRAKGMIDTVALTASRAPDSQKLNFEDFLRAYDNHPEEVFRTLEATPELEEMLDSCAEKLQVLIGLPATIEAVADLFMRLQQVNRKSGFNRDELWDLIDNCIHEVFPEVHGDARDQATLAIMSLAAADEEGILKLPERVFDMPRISSARAAQPAAPVFDSKEGGVVPKTSLETEPSTSCPVKEKHEEISQAAVKKELVPQPSPDTPEQPDDASTGAEAEFLGSDLCPISEKQLRSEFKKYDKEGKGYLDEEDFRDAYFSMENYGIKPTKYEVESIFRKYAGKSAGKITFEQFCLFMLRRARIY